MSQPEAKAYICSVLMQHEKTQEYRLLSDIRVARSEEEALVQTTLMAHPGQGGHDHWVALNKQVHELDREAIERAAREVLGWSGPGGNDERGTMNHERGMRNERMTKE